jgi:AbrB family looped-hinge helix DNA binding protein
VNKQGRLTLPSDVRRRLGIGAGSQLEVSLTNDVIELRRTALIPEEDRWAYTPEAMASLKRGLAQIASGAVFRMTEADLLAGRYPKTRKKVTRGRRR